MKTFNGVIRMRGSRPVLLAMVCVGVLLNTCGAEEGVSPRVDTAVVRGLEFLATRQQVDGSFEAQGPKVAVTSLCLLGFMASGHVAGDGRYGQSMRRGLDFVIDQFPADGYVGKVDNSRMYGQGIITLALAEAYGVERDEARRRRIRPILVKATEVIIAAQKVQKDENNSGGWRYEPGSADSDLSLSGWNALALRACNNIGISANKQSIDRATSYVLKCYRKDQKAFSYQPGQNVSLAMTGVGVLNLCLMDRASAPEVAEAAAYLMSNGVTDDTRFAYYSSYYATHAAFQLGDPAWSKVWKANSEYMVARQQEDGGWPASRSGEEPGRIYATSMAVLTLSAPNRLLPVHQK